MSSNVAEEASVDPKLEEFSIAIQQLHRRVFATAQKDLNHNRMRKKWREWFIFAVWVAVGEATILALEGLGFEVVSYVRWFAIVFPVMLVGGLALIAIRRRPTLHPEVQRWAFEYDYRGLVSEPQLMAVACIWHKLSRIYPLTYVWCKIDSSPFAVVGHGMITMRVDLLAGPIGGTDHQIHAECLLQCSSYKPVSLQVSYNGARDTHSFDEDEQLHLKKAVASFKQRSRKI